MSSQNCANCAEEINYLSINFPNNNTPNYCPPCMQNIIAQYYTFQSCNTQISQLNSILSSYKSQNSQNNSS